MQPKPYFPGPWIVTRHVSEWQLVLGMVLRFVGLLLLIAAAVYLVRQLLLTRAAHTVPPAPPRSPGLDELDLRYARGEVDRTQYLERRADLTGVVPPATPPAP